MNTFDLSKYELDIVNGCILSDACIAKTKRAKNYYFTHTSIHEKYSDFLMQEMNIRIKKYKKKAVSLVMGRECNSKPQFVIRTPNSPTFTKLRKKWYPDNKKIIPRDLELSPVCILHWYLGDGTLCNKNGAIFCTDSFTVEDNSFLVSKLNDLGFCAKIGNRNRIHIPNKRVFELFEYIGLPPFDSMAYKWDTIVKESYINRICKECETRFDTVTNSRYFCSHSCYMRHWRKNGPTLRVTRENCDNEEVQGFTANKVEGL